MVDHPLTIANTSQYRQLDTWHLTPTPPLSWKDLNKRSICRNRNIQKPYLVQVPGTVQVRVVLASAVWLCIISHSCSFSSSEYQLQVLSTYVYLYGSTGTCSYYRYLYLVPVPVVAVGASVSACRYMYLPGTILSIPGTIGLCSP